MPCDRPAFEEPRATEGVVQRVLIALRGPESGRTARGCRRAGPSFLHGSPAGNDGFSGPISA